MSQWEQRQDDIRTLYRLSADLRVGSSRVGLTSSEQAHIKRTVEALMNAIQAYESQVVA